MNKPLLLPVIIAVLVAAGLGCRDRTGEGHDEHGHENHANHLAEEAEDSHEGHDNHKVHGDEDSLHGDAETSGSHDVHDVHDGKETHDEHREQASSDGDGDRQKDSSEEHSDETAEDHDKHEDHGEAGEVILTPAAMEIAGIVIGKVKTAALSQAVELGGEVGFDEDRLAHVVPRFPGIVKQVYKNLGDAVEAGETLASIESNESMSRYQLTSLVSGTVIKKHLTLGEFVSDEDPVFVVADLSRVWVNLAVYAKDADKVRIGQTVSIEAVGRKIRAEGRISYIDRVYNPSTRNLTARVVLSNPGNRWSPGAFIRGLVGYGKGKPVPVVEKEAVQRIGDRLCVFVPVKGEPGAFIPAEVTVAGEDGRCVHVSEGLHIGDEYVSQGAFELKSELSMDSRDPHAGHGH